MICNRYCECPSHKCEIKKVTGTSKLIYFVFDYPPGESPFPCHMSEGQLSICKLSTLAVNPIKYINGLVKGRIGRYYLFRKVDT